ncbi:hypothetical protein AC91_4152 [Escherichia coli 6-175-07_S4_C1]|nr:hypothetical protein AC91_4152 [Escherichia coli 6-175-07_S4_C1]KEM45565.1 hypothetical protein AD46_4160 [Escherichia coli 6-175-07_S4_C3]
MIYVICITFGGEIYATHFRHGDEYHEKMLNPSVKCLFASSD